jgi:hypothetical protein
MIFNLRRDPFERAEFNSNTYYDWLINHVPQTYLMQEAVARQIEGFVKFPPRQKPAAFNLDAVMAQATAAGQAISTGGAEPKANGKGKTAASKPKTKTTVGAR